MEIRLHNEDEICGKFKFIERPEKFQIFHNLGHFEMIHIGRKRQSFRKTENP